MTTQHLKALIYFYENVHKLMISFFSLKKDIMSLGIAVVDR